jgi:hypothetical protein
MTKMAAEMRWFVAGMIRRAHPDKTGVRPTHRNFACFYASGEYRTASLTIFNCCYALPDDTRADR